MAIVLGIMALYTMITFNGSFDSKSKEFTDFMIEEEFNKQYVMEQAKLIFNESVIGCGECSADAFKQKIKENAGRREEINRYEGAGNFYGKLRSSEFEVENDREEFRFEIKDLFVKSERGYNKIQRNFDICFESENGSVVECG